MAAGDERLDLRRVRLLYLRTAVPLETLAAMLGLSRTVLERRRQVWGWPRRTSRRDQPGRASSPAGLDRSGGIDRLATGRAMERFIAGRIAACEADASAGRDAEPERTARTVSHYARALGLVRSYLVEIEKDEHAVDTGPPPRSLSELRDELRRHLDRLHDEGAALGGLQEA